MLEHMETILEASGELGEDFALILQHFHYIWAQFGALGAPQGTPKTPSHFRGTNLPAF